MPIEELNHYFVWADDLDATKSFYCDVLGFEVMPRPDLPFAGYWLGVNGTAHIHMGQHDAPDAKGSHVATSPTTATDGSGVIDHIAFLATDPEQISEQLERFGVEANRRFLAEFGVCQIRVDDPNGLTVELNFFGIDHEPNW